MSGPRCSLPVVEWDYDVMGMPTSATRVCGAELYVNWAFSVPVAGMEDEAVNGDDVPNCAVSSSWRLECVEGHTVVTSDGSRDNAEDFDGPVVLGALFGIQVRPGDA